MSEPEVVQYAGVVFTREAIWSEQDTRDFRKAKTDSLKRITARKGLIAKSPLMQLVMAGVLLGVAGVLAASQLQEMNAGEPLSVCFLVAIGFFGLLGLWLLFDVSKIGWYIDVRTGRHRFKFPLDKSADPVEIRRLFNSLRNQFDWPIDDPL